MTIIIIIRTSLNLWNELCVVPSGPPTGIKENIINSTTVQILWSPPVEDKQNGRITFYSVALSGNESNRLIQYNIISNSTLMDLPPLRPFSEYNVTIAASTAVGIGPFTFPYIFHTPQDGMYVQL